MEMEPYLISRVTVTSGKFYWRGIQFFEMLLQEPSESVSGQVDVCRKTKTKAKFKVSKEGSTKVIFLQK